MMTVVQKILESFSRTTDEILSLDEFRSKLESGRQLRIKFGADVTAPFLHIGHAVNLWMMRELQEAGHKVVFLIGDFTTRIGDPTGRLETRQQIDTETIETNAVRFIEQIGHVLITDDAEVFEVRRNSEFYEQMSVDSFLKLLAMVTHARMISRDMFKKRMAAGQDIHLHEFIYPVLQGYDSVALESDLTIVGSDQLFNEMMGRFFQEKFGQPPQVVITTKITPGLDGRQKQSKSLNNYVAITDTPRDKFGKIMQLPDELIVTWFEIYTRADSQKIARWQKNLASGEANPRDVKLELAASIVERYHGKSAANREKEWFEKTFSKQAFPSDAPEISLKAGEMRLLDVLTVILHEDSRTELRRLICQGAVKMNGARVDDPDMKMVFTSSERKTLKIGKRRFFRIHIT